MNTYNATLEIQIPDDLFTSLQCLYGEFEKDGIYDSFDSFMHDIIDLRILRHMKNNAELITDMNNHFCKLVQT